VGFHALVFHENIRLKVIYHRYFREVNILFNYLINKNYYKISGLIKEVPCFVSLDSVIDEQFNNFLITIKDLKLNPSTGLLNTMLPLKRQKDKYIYV